ncbi:unnamed protein product [Effrenium voratum]|nr:unnamed protein product [Effrenium voratum]
MAMAAKHVVESIKKIAVPVSDSDMEKIKQVGAISAGGDEEAGQMIADAMSKVGGSGVISLEESQSTDTEVELTEGMNLDKGYLSPYLCLDASNPTSRKWESTNPLILVTDQKISMAQQELIPILTLAKQMSKPLLIIADTIEKEVLATLIVNKIRGIVDCCAVQAPGFGDNRKAILQDIALVTGATYITEELGRKLDSIEPEDFGTARRITVSKDATTIVADAPKEALEERCEQLRRQIEETKSSYTKEQLEKRLAKLVGGVALIKVGATTETELKDKKLRLEDAINATKAAVDEGIVPGGGACLCHMSKSVREWAMENLSEDELKGALIVAESMSAPMKRIAANAGQNGDLVAEKVMAAESTTQGFDALMLEYGDMLECGIIDPAKVARSALQNASSIASMILTTECVVVDADSKEDDDDDGEEDFARLALQLPRLDLEAQPSDLREKMSRLSDSIASLRCLGRTGASKSRRAGGQMALYFLFVDGDLSSWTTWSTGPTQLEEDAPAEIMPGWDSCASPNGDAYIGGWRSNAASPARELMNVYAMLNFSSKKPYTAVILTVLILQLHKQEPLGLRQTSSQSVSGGGSSRSQFRAAGLRVMFGNYWSSSTRGNEEAPLSQAEQPTQGEVSLKPPNRATHVAAEIAFDGGTSPYCVISHSAPPKDVFEQVIGPVWYLRTPNLVLSIMGGAGNMNLAPDKFDIDGFSKGLVEAATRTCAWVITGGTASGVMDIVGKAMQRHDKQRQVPCIGISPFGALTSKWREILCSPYEHHSKMTKVDAAAAAKAEKGLAALQETITRTSSYVTTARWGMRPSVRRSLSGLSSKTTWPRAPRTPWRSRVS